MNTKSSVFVICVEVIIHLLLDNLHDCTFNINTEYWLGHSLKGAVMQII